MTKLVEEICKDPFTVAELLEVVSQVVELDKPAAVNYDNRLYAVRLAARTVLQRIAREAEKD